MPVSLLVGSFAIEQNGRPARRKTWHIHAALAAPWQSAAHPTETAMNRQQASPLDTWQRQAPAARHKAVGTTSQYLTMRDGTRIAIDVMLPADLPAGARLPTLMIMARYWRSMALWLPSPRGRAPIGPREMTVDYFVQCGFAVVVVDARGAGASGGVNRYPWSADELADYAEVAHWVCEQPWSSGSIGAYGISYEGAAALRLAASGVPGVRAVIPQEIEFDVYDDVALPGGVFNEAFIRNWNASNQALDRNRPSALFPWLARLLVRGVRPVDADPQRVELRKHLSAHQANTDVYAAISGITFRDDPFGSTGVTLDDFSVYAHTPALEAGGAALFSWGSWLDGTTAEAALRTFNTFSNPQVVVIGAWKHEMTAHGSPYQPPRSAPNPTQQEQWQAMAGFFAQALIQQKPITGKTLRYYTLGEEVWRETDTFPLPGTRHEAWYFQPQGGLAPQRPGDADASDSYTVDFSATTGTTNRWHTQFARPVAYSDRAAADERLLTYTSAPLPHDMEVTGCPTLTLYVASSHDDGAFFVYLEDVDPQGVVRYITEGQLRGIHRRLSSAPLPYVTSMPPRSYRRADAAPLPPGQVVELVIGLQPTSALLRRGHRLRVALAGADKDSFARIPAAGTPRWQVMRSAQQASAISLPVVPRP